MYGQTTPIDSFAVGDPIGLLERRRFQPSIALECTVTRATKTRLVVTDRNGRELRLLARDGILTGSVEGGSLRFDIFGADRAEEFAAALNAHQKRVTLRSLDTLISSINREANEAATPKQEDELLELMRDYAEIVNGEA